MKDFSEFKRIDKEEEINEKANCKLFCDRNCL